MDKEKIFAFLEDMIDALTFRRVALLSLLASICIVLLSAYENRAALFATVYKGAEPVTAIKWELSDDSKNQLIATTNNSFVGAILLTDVDLKKNRRTTKYYYVKDPKIAEQVKIAASKILPQALFDYDAKNTDQMVAMLNNEFRCTPTKDTVFVRFFPDFPKSYPIVCRIAVPPFFGEFAGFITVMLTRTPKPEEFDAIKIEMNRIAIETYLRDISKKPVI